MRTDVGFVQCNTACTSRRRLVSICALEEIKVGAAISHAVDMGRVGSMGASAGSGSDEMSAVHVVVGKTEGGQRLLSFAAEKPKKGMRIPVQTEFSVPVPEALDDASAATLSIISVLSLGAMETRGIGGKQENFSGKKAVILGGIDGGVSSVAIQLLAGWGADVVAVTTSNAYQTSALGASKIIDPRRTAFHEAVQDFDFVVDSLGDETNSSVVSVLRGSPFNAEYVSIASPLLLRAFRDGLVRGGAAISSMARGQIPADIHTPFLPSETGIQVIESALEMVKHSKVDHIPSSVVSAAELFQAFRWPRDADTGLRYGLPARSLFDSPGVVEEKETILEQVYATTIDLFVGDETASLVESAAELKTVIGSTAKQSIETAVLFVGAPWCKRCKELLPTFKNLASKVGGSRPEVRFLMLDADRLGGVAKTLEVTDVPEIVVFRDGKRVPAWLNTRTANLMEISIMNVL